MAEKKYSQLEKEALAIIFAVRKFHQYLYGRPFELKTDHKPLTYIFNEKKGIPVLSSRRIQRWALTLGAYSYTITYKEGKYNVCADAMSRLPLQVSSSSPPKPADVIHLLEYLDTSPVTSTQVRSWTDRDPVLSRVRDWILTGWPAKEGDGNNLFQPYIRRRYELSVEDGCVLWGNRIVIPNKGRKALVSILHEGDTGIVRMKSFARGYVWWPNMDHELEQCVQACNVCQLQRKSPPVTPSHPWAWPDKPWSRIHIDYAGPIEGKMFLVVVDAYSKWLDVHMTSSTTTSATLELLRKSFATLGLPEVVVSDNAANFTSEEFRSFMKRNGIKHVRTPPYHPASNGIAERAVQTLKDSIKKLKKGSLETRLSRFLFKYHVTPHSVTGVAPADIMFGRRLRTHLDVLKPDLSRKVIRNNEHQKNWYNIRVNQRDFKVGDLVYARNYATGPKWLPGKIVESSGNVLFTVALMDGRQVRKHTDQLIKRYADSNDQADEEQLDHDDIPVSSNNEDSTNTAPAVNIPPDIPELSADTTTTSHSDSHTLSRSTTPDRTTESPIQDEEQSRESAPPTVTTRRSSRTRNPPNRYGNPYVY